MNKPAKENTGTKLIADNRKARFNYAIGDTFEAGIVLMGSEAKSLRLGHVNFGDAYAFMKSGELFLIGLKIEAYKQATHEGHEPERTRKLLMHKKELERLQKEINIKKISLIPLKLYFKSSRVKVLIGKGLGKSKGDKRDTIKKREADIAVGRALKRGTR